MNENDLAWTTDPYAAAMAMSEKDLSEPIGMLNLLKFRERADYGPGSDETPCSGAAAYARYVQHVTPILDSIGAQIILSGYLWMLGEAADWDRAFVVKYKSASDLLALPQRPDYQRIAHHRNAALADTKLLMMDFDASAFS